MKFFSFTQFKILFKYYFINFFFSSSWGNKKKDAETYSELNKKKRKECLKKILTLILVGISFLMLLGYLVMFVSMITGIAIQNGNIKSMLYFIMGLGQILILFLGIGSVFNYIYFSTDNALMQSLPISSKTVFLAKFSMAYLSQLVISFCVLLPAMITLGITSAKYDFYLGAQFYILACFTPIVAPLIPLLAVSIISVPVMYLISFVKNRALAKDIFSAVISLGVVAFYFVMLFLINPTEISDDSMIENNTALMALIKNISRFSIFNYNWVEAMLGNNIFANILIYIVITVVAIIIILIISDFTYKRSVSFSLEEGKGITRINKNRNYNQKHIKGILSQFIVKDIKTVISEPSLLISIVMGLILVPVMTVLSGQINFYDEKIPVECFELYVLSFLSYLTLLMMCCTNYIGLIGISIEGKNFAFLKSLPIKSFDIIKSKLVVANIYNLFVCIELFITNSIMSKNNFGPLINLIDAIFIFFIGFGVSCYGLYSDLRKPMFIWENIQKLTKNNTRIIKPMLFALAFGFLIMAMGIVCGMCFADKLTIAYAIYLFALAVLSMGFAGVTAYKLIKNADELIMAIEI